MSQDPSAQPSFDELGLDPKILEALRGVGYERPSPIQAATIPHLLADKDLVGQAQTGTGKTAAFALPILSRLELEQQKPSVLVLTPTRELAIQVAEAFQRYATHLKGFRVVPIYGGQAYEGQLRQLRRGVHVVVGTPGRVMDHMRRGTLALDQLRTLVLDEADEMLRMGFLEDVEWVLEQTPDERQVALFSATMPRAVRRIAQRHLTEPEEVTIEVKTTTADTIRHRFWVVSGLHKLDALTRILEVEPFDAMIVFVRTKTATVELAERLSARGFPCAAINGDMVQAQRERTIEQLRRGRLDILVATDVAARGLDVERVSHVINFDIPYDTDSYVHRVGRTGRAGRKGEAILFVAPRERRMLRAIEMATRQTIERMDLPSASVVNDRRIDKFFQRITDAREREDLAFFHQLMERYQQEHDVSGLEIASALAKILQGGEPLLLEDNRKKRPPRDAPARNQERPDKKRARAEPGKRPRAPESADRPSGEAPEKGRPSRVSTPAHILKGRPERGMEKFRIEVGRTHKVRPGDIVGAIANEAGLMGEHIGRIELFETFSTVELPEGMPREIFRDLKSVRIQGQRLDLSRLSQRGPGFRRQKAAFEPGAEKTSEKPGRKKRGGFGPGFSGPKPKKGPKGKKKGRAARLAKKRPTN